MREAASRGRRRPSIRLILGAMIVIALTTPLVGLFFLRVIENQLIRATEGELIGQSAALAAIYAAELKMSGVSPALFGPRAGAEFAPPGEDRFAPLPPSLDLARAEILPPRPEPRLAPGSPDLSYAPVFARLSAVARATTQRTLAGVSFLDAAGRVLGADPPADFAHVPEVRQAMKGRYAAVLRTRLRERPPPFVYALTKGASLRVFTAYPVLVDGRVAGVVYASRSPRHLLQMIWAERDKLIAAGAALIVLGVIFGALASAAITGPIRALTARARAIEAGDRSAMRPLARPGTREVAELSEIFMGTARRLHDRTDDVSAFAAHVSHELKSPLTAIQGAAELIRDMGSEMGDEDREAFLDAIVSNSGRMTLLVRRLLELARADATDDDEGPAVVADLAPALAKRADLRVEVDDPGRVGFAISPEKLEIALSNLIDNAAAHGAKTVLVTVDADARSGPIRVVDDGPGVSKGNARRVFDPFFTTRRDAGGTGMGLPIVRAMLEARGGGIALGPNDPGAAFRIHLPRA